ncbi:hypothetical protein LCGC14_2570470, partial [marine sediment metagenome]
RAPVIRQGSQGDFFEDLSLPDETPGAAERARQRIAAESAPPVATKRPPGTARKVVSKTVRGAGKVLAPMAAFANAYELATIGMDAQEAIEKFDADAIEKEAKKIGMLTALMTGTAVGGAAGLIGGPFAPLTVPMGLLLGGTATGLAMLYDTFKGEGGELGINKLAQDAGVALDEKTGKGLTSFMGWVTKLTGITESRKRGAKDADERAARVGHEGGGFWGMMRDWDVNPLDAGSFLPGLFGAGQEVAPGQPATQAPVRPQTQDERLQRLAKIQTAGPPGFEMAGGPATVGKMYLPSQFAPGPKTGPRVPKVTTGTARTDYIGDEAFFPQAQQFKHRKTDLSGSYQPFEGTRSKMEEAGKYKSVIQALSRGDTVYRPSEGGAGVRAGEPGAAQRYIENLRSARQRAAGHYGGASNQGVVGDANAQQLLGVPVTSAQPTLSATGQLQQRGTSEIVSREDEARAATTAGGTGEVSQA